MKRPLLAAAAVAVFLVGFVAFAQVAERMYTYPVRWQSRFVVERNVAQFDVGARIGDGGTTTSLMTWSSCASADAGTGLGTCTASVRASSKCLCQNATTAAVVKCAVSSTTLTATTEAEGDTIAYLCLSP